MLEGRALSTFNTRKQVTGEIGNYSRRHRVELKLRYLILRHCTNVTSRTGGLRNLYFLVFRFHFTENVPDPKCHEFKSRPEQNLQSTFAFG